jgi:SAM-dependent methyltransferase
MLMEMAEAQNDGLESMANLRFDALMTSKWLSFGRVLFSPAHAEMKNTAEDRVLVLDGLGKDWSFYCALTYPGATVYNLDPNPSQAHTETDQQAAFESLPNHRHVHHPDISHPFPFPRGFFNAVVFRFPVASPEVAYRCAISECKRVLRPGGFLEISVLDLDMMNMGNRARRAVRGLKVRMQDADPTVSLKSASDNIQRLLGRRGFENLNRCMVGVPATGRIPSSRDGSVGGAGGRSTTGSRQSVNFSDLLGSSASQTSGHGSQTSEDEGITKMVAKVGRWWYSRCYESLVLPDGDLSHSIWSDEALIRECEELQTSFRLLVCYAQKPTLTPRRTISV